MSRQTLFVLVVVLALIGFGAYFALNNNATENIVVNNNQNTDSAAGTSEEGTDPVNDTPEAPINVNSETHTVSMTGDAFGPTPLEIKKGDVVVFKNDGTTLVWPASAPHPQHTNYPEFDAEPGVEPGTSWSFQFDKVGTWNYHDHLKPTYFGRIVVTE